MIDFFGKEADTYDFIKENGKVLNDHNEARTLGDIGMRKEDFKMLKEKGIR